jgi:predicted branched-subunit amino acid permease
MPGPATAVRSRRFASDFSRGAFDIAPIVVATVPFGLVFGAIAAHGGLAFDDSVLLSALTFAGASQFAALEFWAHPLPFLTILLSVIAVNLRLVLYSAALARRIGHWSVPARWVGLGLLSDPIYALAELNGGARLSAAYYFGLAVPLYLNWIVTTAAGYLFGNLIRDPAAVGLDFVVIAYFIHLLAGFRTRPNALAVIAASAAGSVLAYVTVGSPWHFAGGAAAGVTVAAALARPGRAPV